MICDGLYSSSTRKSRRSLFSEDSFIARLELGYGRCEQVVGVASKPPKDLFALQNLWDEAEAKNQKEDAKAHSCLCWHKRKCTMMAQNGQSSPRPAPRRIVAVEEDEALAVAAQQQEEDFIPGPPEVPSSTASLGSSGSGGKRGSLFLRVLNVSGKGRINKKQQQQTQQQIEDELRLSGTDHDQHEYVAGAGILASREDLAMAPEDCKLQVVDAGGILIVLLLAS